MDKIRLIVKILLILIAIVVLTVIVTTTPGCTPNSDVKTTRVDTEKEYVIYQTSSGKARMRVLKFEYDGHSYIMFGEGDSRMMVHDPDCPCHN